jgi:hypothetical protein
VGLLYVANSVLKDISDTDWRYYFLQCIHGYQDLFPSFPIVEGIVRGLLVLAVNQRRIMVPEAKQIHQELLEKRSYHWSPERVYGAFIIDLDLAVIDGNAATVDTLAERFEEIRSFDGPTEGIF